MRTKEEDTIELAMRFAVALRVPGMLTPGGMTKFSAANGYDDGDMDRKLARYVVAMSREFVEEMHRGAGAPTPEVDALIQRLKAPSEGFVSEPLDWQTEMDATIKARRAAQKPDIEIP